jgi:hypothetical protein
MVQYCALARVFPLRAGYPRCSNVDRTVSETISRLSVRWETQRVERGSMQLRRASSSRGRHVGNLYRAITRSVTN